MVPADVAFSINVGVSLHKALILDPGARMHGIGYTFLDFMIRN